MAAPQTTQTHPALYRAAQFLAALKAGLPAWAGGVKGTPTAADKALVTWILPAPAQQRLFNGMPPNDQRHALAVVQTLQQAGYSQPALLQAALLHDAGKSIGQPLIHRVLIVLLEAFWPAALQWLSTSRGLEFTTFGNSQPSAIHNLRQFTTISWWRRPFVIHAHHPAIGAAWAAEAVCEPLAVRLIAKHQADLKAEPVEAEDKLLAALQWADDLN